MSLLLKRVREEKRLTHEQVYNDTRIHVGRIEAEKPNIHISTLSILRRYYDIKLSDFLKMIEES